MPFVRAGEPALAAQAAAGGVEARRVRAGVDLRYHRPREAEVLARRGHERPVRPHAPPLRLVGPAPARPGEHRIGAHVGRQPASASASAPAAGSRSAVRVAHGDRRLAAEAVEVVEVGGHRAVHPGHRLVDAEVVCRSRRTTRGRGRWPPRGRRGSRRTAGWGCRCSRGRRARRRRCRRRTPRARSLCGASR